MPNVAEAAAARLAQLLSGQSDELAAPGRRDLDFLATVELAPLERAVATADCWAVDGGQALVADARCLQVGVTRVARTRWQDRAAAPWRTKAPRTVHLFAGEGRRDRGEALAR